MVARSALVVLGVWGALLGPGSSAVLAADGRGPAELAYRAGKAAPNEKEARRLYQSGIDAARATLRTAPNDPAALLWLAANLGSEALTHGRVHALGVVPEIESTLLRLEQLHPDYNHAAAARALGNLYWKAPSLISVGSSKKAATYFQLALQRAPDYPGNLAMAAAFFADNGDCARARSLALAVRGRADLDTFGPDGAEWRQMAVKVLHDCE